MRRAWLCWARRFCSDCSTVWRSHPASDACPISFQTLDCVALLLILATVGLLLATPSFHDPEGPCHLALRRTCVWRDAGDALALALGIDVAIGLVGYAGSWSAGLAGGTFVLLAILVWHVVPICAATRRERKDDPMKNRQQSLEARIVQALTELRVILPGRAGTVRFSAERRATDRFEQLGAISKVVHMASLGVVAIAIVTLIAPASYHRIAAAGNAEEGVLRYTVAMMLPAEGLIALGLVGESYVAVSMISDSFVPAIALSLAAAIGFAVLLYEVPLAVRGRHVSGRAAR